MPGQTRFSAAIIQDGNILLIEHHHFAGGDRYWILPGGHQEPGETDTETVCREVQEETGLIVRVERLLFEEPSTRGGAYTCYKTYLCTPLVGTAQPGYEPEDDAKSRYEISAVRWVDLSNESGWGQGLQENPVTGPLLRKIRENLF